MLCKLLARTIYLSLKETSLHLAVLKQKLSKCCPQLLLEEQGRSFSLLKNLSELKSRLNQVLKFFSLCRVLTVLRRLCLVPLQILLAQFHFAKEE